MNTIKMDRCEELKKELEQFPIPELSRCMWGDEAGNLVLDDTSHNKEEEKVSKLPTYI